MQQQSHQQQLISGLDTLDSSQRIFAGSNVNMDNRTREVKPERVNWKKNIMFQPQQNGAPIPTNSDSNLTGLLMSENKSSMHNKKQTAMLMQAQNYPNYNQSMQDTYNKQIKSSGRNKVSPYRKYSPIKKMAMDNYQSSTQKIGGGVTSRQHSYVSNVPFMMNKKSHFHNSDIEDVESWHNMRKSLAGASEVYLLPGIMENNMSAQNLAFGNILNQDYHTYESGTKVYYQSQFGGITNHHQSFQIGKQNTYSLKAPTMNKGKPQKVKLMEIDEFLRKIKARKIVQGIDQIKSKNPHFQLDDSELDQYQKQKRHVLHSNPMRVTKIKPLTQYTSGMSHNQTDIISNHQQIISNLETNRRKMINKKHETMLLQGVGSINQRQQQHNQNVANSSNEDQGLPNDTMSNEEDELVQDNENATQFTNEQSNMSSNHQIMKCNVHPKYDKDGPIGNLTQAQQSLERMKFMNQKTANTKKMMKTYNVGSYIFGDKHLGPIPKTSPNKGSIHKRVPPIDIDMFNRTIQNFPKIKQVTVAPRISNVIPEHEKTSISTVYSRFGKRNQSVQNTQNTPPLNKSEQNFTQTLHANNNQTDRVQFQKMMMNQTQPRNWIDQVNQTGLIYKNQMRRVDQNAQAQEQGKSLNFKFTLQQSIKRDGVTTDDKTNESVMLSLNSKNELLKQIQEFRGKNLPVTPELSHAKTDSKTPQRNSDKRYREGKLIKQAHEFSAQHSETNTKITNAKTGGKEDYFNKFNTHRTIRNANSQNKMSDVIINRRESTAKTFKQSNESGYYYNHNNSINEISTADRKRHNFKLYNEQSGHQSVRFNHRDVSVGASVQSVSPGESSKRSNFSLKKSNQGYISYNSPSRVNINQNSKFKRTAMLPPNFYKLLEKSPEIALEENLKIQEQVRNIQKQVRMRKQQIQEVKQEIIKNLKTEKEHIARHSKLQDALYILQNSVVQTSMHSSENILVLHPNYSTIQEHIHETNDSKELFSTARYSNEGSKNVQHETNLLEENNVSMKNINNNNIYIKSLETNEDERVKIQNEEFILENASFDHSMPAKQKETAISESKHSRSPQKLDSNISSKFNQSPAMLGEQRSKQQSPFIVIQRVESQTPKFSDQNAQKVVADVNADRNALTERRIHSLYKNQVQSDMQKSKLQLEGTINLVKIKAEEEKKELTFQLNENKRLKAMLVRYKKYIDHFDDESKNMKKFLAAKTRKRVQGASIDVRRSMINSLNDKENSIVSPGTNKSGSGYPGKRNPSIAEKPGSSHEKYDNIQQALIEAGSRSCSPPHFQNQQATIPSILKQDTSVYSKNSRYQQFNQMESIFYGNQGLNLIGRFMLNIKNMCKVQRCLDLGLLLIDHLKSIFQCQKIMLVPLENQLTQLLTNNIPHSFQKYVHPIEYTDQHDPTPRVLSMLARTQSDVCDEILFNTIVNQTSDLVIKNNKMAVLVRQQDKKNQPSFLVQLEYHESREDSKLKQRKNNKSSLKDDDQSSIYGEVKKFQKHEASIMKMFMRFIGLKFEKIIIMHRAKNDPSLSIKSHSKIITMMQCKTLRGLMRYIYQFFQDEFEEMNVLFMDKEKESLYTITFGDDQETQLLYKKKLKIAKSEKEKESILNQWSMEDVTLRANQMIYTPANVGLTKICFHEMKSIVINDFHLTKNFDFVNEIDNPKDLKQIRNLLFTPLINQAGQIVGMLQMFNHRSNQVVGFNKRRNAAFGRFLGGCIENIEEKTKKLTTVVAVELMKKQSMEAVEVGYRAIAEDGSMTDYLNLMKHLETMEVEYDRQSMIAQVTADDQK